MPLGNTKRDSDCFHGIVKYSLFIFCFNNKHSFVCFKLNHSATSEMNMITNLKCRICNGGGSVGLFSWSGFQSMRWFQTIKAIWPNLISNCFIWTPPPNIYPSSIHYVPSMKTHKQIKDTITEEDECLDYDNSVTLSGLALFHHKSRLCCFVRL